MKKNNPKNLERECRYFNLGICKNKENCNRYGRIISTRNLQGNRRITETRCLSYISGESLEENPKFEQKKY